MPQSSIKPVTYDTNVLRTPQGEPWKAMIFGEVVKEVVGAATVPRRSTRRIADDADPLLLERRIVMFRPTRAAACGYTLVFLVGFLMGSLVLPVRGQDPRGNSPANGKARVDAVANAQTPRHKEIEMLTLSQASAIVDHALAYARGHDLRPETIAVLDARGCIVALKMEDGSGLMRPDIAVGKAWGALGMGFGTRNLAGSAKAAPQFYGALADLAKGRVVPVPGGVLVRDQEQRLIGAVGASGDTSDNDEAMVLAGIAAVSGLIADPGQAPPPPEKTTMIRAYYLYTGEDGNSHVVRGSVHGGELVEAESILFKETPPHSSLDWHNDPIPQYVINLSGVLEYATKGGETFTTHPGDVVLATDHTGSGHKWRLVNDEPWKRAYVVFKKGANTRFIPDKTK
jgi:uncharacterized protein GlcG (DUF336 family)/quercetin dioxygenase-like cupin family protein